jgi:phenylalanyl-tRNA synthetase alpha chain
MQALSELVEAAAAEIDAASDLAALDAVRVSYLGKKGKLTERLKSLSQLPAEDRPAAGQEINQAKQEVMGRINARRETLESAALEERLAKDAVDVTLPGRGYEIGGRHPVTRAMSRDRRRFSQLYCAQYSGESSGAGHARYVLFPGRAAAAYTHLSRSDTVDGGRGRTHTYYCARPRLPL